MTHENQDIDMESIESGSTLACEELEPKDKAKLDELSFNLRKKFDSQRQLLSQNFESLKELLELRQMNLLAELNKDYNEKQKKLENFFSSNEKENNSPKNSLENLLNLLNENLEFKTEIKIDKFNLNIEKLIEQYGSFIKQNGSKNENKSLIQCKINGIGLTQAHVNEITKFTLSLSNLDGSISKSNVSLLDIFITTEARTTIALAEAGIKTSAPLRSNFNSSISKYDRSKKSNCECKLEYLSDGVYSVNYKLDKKGTYLVNILLNKKHIAESPYIIKCTEKKKTEIPKKTVKAQSSYSIMANN